MRDGGVVQRVSEGSKGFGRFQGRFAGLRRVSWGIEGFGGSPVCFRDVSERISKSQWIPRSFHGALGAF